MQLDDERGLAEDVLLGAAASHFNSAPSFSQEGQEVRFGVRHLYMFYFFRIGSWRVGGVLFACNSFFLLNVVFVFIVRGIMFADIFEAFCFRVYFAAYFWSNVLHTIFSLYFLRQLFPVACCL